MRRLHSSRWRTHVKQARALQTAGRLAELLEYCDDCCVKAILTISSRGVVTLPARLRRALGLRPQDQLIAETVADGLLLRPALTLPVEIYNDERIREFDESEAELARFIQKIPSR